MLARHSRTSHGHNLHLLFSNGPDSAGKDYEYAEHHRVLNCPFSSSHNHKLLSRPCMSGLEVAGLVLTLVDLGRRFALAVKDVSSYQ